ncbi:MAG: ureidoglycolate lyase [Cyanobacteria bacterium P01_E01_bin.42]
MNFKKLATKKIETDNFAPFGQLILPARDGKPYDEDDAQLNLKNGTPRFYIMRLQQRGRKFSQITRHRLCTQCLGSLDGQEWFIAVAPPCQADRPKIDNIVAFRIPGDCFIKLEAGTWHAGPYFDPEIVAFYNLELSNTNEIDRHTHDFLKSDELEFEIV